MIHTVDTQVRAIRAYLESEEDGIELADMNEEYDILRNLITKELYTKFETLLNMHQQIIRNEIYMFKRAELNTKIMPRIEILVSQTKKHAKHLDEMIKRIKPEYNRSQRRYQETWETQSDEEDSYEPTQIAKCIKCGNVAKFKCKECRVAHFCSKDCAQIKDQ